MTSFQTLKFYKDLGHEIIGKNYTSSLKYRILDSSEFGKIADGALANQIFWSEMLTKAHWSAIGTISRNCKWIEGMLFSVEMKNFLLFSSSLRALIESSGDSMTSLNVVPKYMAKYFSHIKQSIEGIAKDKVVEVSALEDRLNHFIFAEKPSSKEKRAGQISDTQIAKSTSDYIAILDDNEKDGSINALYKTLCQVTHPAALSILYSMKQSSFDGSTEFTFIDDPDIKAINHLLDNCEQEIAKICQYGFNTSLILLKTLNFFNLPNITTPNVDKWSFDTNSWRDIENKIVKS